MNVFKRWILRKYVKPELQAVIDRARVIEAQGKIPVPMLIIANRIEEIRLGKY